MAGFQDHFSGHAADYALFRPRYPGALFDHLASLAASRQRAWDCGTGNGQAAVALAERFAEVVATDASAEQIANAEPHPRVRYAVAPAERSGLEPGSVDLVTVGQALHWFDRERFWTEARRVMRQDAVIAAWCYERFTIGPGLDPVLARLYDDVVGRDWPEERALVENGYRDIRFPFDELRAPELWLEAAWDLARLVGYIGTWSATRRYRARTGNDPVCLVRSELEAAWGDPAASRTVRWPLRLRVGRIGPAG